MSPSGSFASVLILAFAAIAYCRPYAGRYQPESKGKDERHARSPAAFDESLTIPAASRDRPDVRVGLG